MRFCWIGIHKWTRWHQYGVQIHRPSMPDDAYVPQTRENRRCAQCGTLQDRMILDSPIPGVSIEWSNVTETEDRAPIGLDG